MSTPVKIQIDPRCIISYTSYYIFGIKLTWPTIAIDWEVIPDLSIEGINDYREGLATIVTYNDGFSQKVYIASNDPSRITNKFYEWADVFAKINLKLEDLSRTKAIAIGPNFGIQLWNPLKTVVMGVLNYLRCGRKAPVSFKRYMLDYIYMFVRRLPYQRYFVRDCEDAEYVHQYSTLWYNQHAVQFINRYRVAFAKACKEVYNKADVGFFYVEGEDVLCECPNYPNYLQEFGDMIIHRRVSMKEYIDGCRKSDIVFNTPAVVGCHGWKLAEYLAMGKAIISTPLNNVMPGNFKAGVHYIEVNSEEEIANAVKMLKNNMQIKENLRNNAARYFDKYLSPKAVVKRIFERK